MSASKAENQIGSSVRSAPSLRNRKDDPEIADYRDQFEKLKAARKRLAKFRASTAAQAKAKAAKEQESTGEAPPKQLNKTWPEFVRLILAPKRRKRIDGSTAGNLDYLQTAERCRALFAQHGRLGKIAGR